MSDRLEEAFADKLEELRAMVAEVGIEPKNTAREVLTQVIENNIQHIGERLASLHSLVMTVAHALEGGHAVFTAGIAAGAILTSRQLLTIGALRSIQHALVCEGHHPHEHEPQESPIFN